MSDTTSSDEAQIRACIENWAAATRAKDADRLVRDYDPEVLVFDMLPPLRYKGVARYREINEGWFQNWDSAIDCQIQVEQLEVSGDLALALCLTTIGGQRGGDRVDMRMRVTVGFKRISGAWKVIHEHVSVPIDMETLQPCFNLPE